MARPSIQFSLQSLFCFLVVMSVMLAMNLTPAVYTTQIWLSISLPPGESNDREWVTVERGFPIRYQSASEDVAHGTGEAVIAAGWPRSGSVPTVTHVHWLVLDILFATGLSTLVAWGVPRVGVWNSESERLTIRLQFGA